MSELLITEFFDHTCILGLKENKIEYLDIIDIVDRTGNIYVGRVENIVSNINAAFVRFEKNGDKNGIGFLPLNTLPAQCVLNRDVESSKELKAGDIVLVQIKVEAQKTKQPRLTGKLKLSFENTAGDLQNLIAIAKTRSEYQQIAPEETGISCVVNKTYEIFSQICDEAPDRIVTDNRSIYEELTGADVDCTYYDEEEQRLPLKVHYSLTSRTEDIFKKNVWLKSGAFLVIEQTETLNLIDVNSGKNLKKSDMFFLEQNKEAAKEAYRQIRLRNLSGMILIDFISMKDKSMNSELIAFIKDLIKNDPMNLSFVDLTGLGIMEFTRNKKKKSLRETIDTRNK
ncbi:ribonuclease E/G [Butyrivibrio sp. WCE2006]|uniref:ribonuclease E/G n=1 Tax=Butyrivibrio sp. WCE2006 TaxID=1410611 RepID=UPI0006794ADE|nr:ribonuclease E/G [Butyrivibrio sp. WCE2006]